MSLPEAGAGVRAAWSGLQLAVSEPTVRKTYLQLALALLLGTVLLYGGLGWTAWTLTDGEQGWWILIRVMALLLVLLSSPVIALYLVHALAPLFAERVFLAALKARGSSLADGLVAGEGLPLLTSVGISLKRLVRYVGLSLCIFAFSLIPFVGSAMGPPLQLLLSARMLSGELLDPYLSMRNMRWDAQRTYLQSHRPALVGFGIPWALIFAVPLVGALVFGLAQAAAAVLVADVLEPDEPEETRT
jgi:uncharacterized protein involved in cysteine biosynthesis